MTTGTASSHISRDTHSHWMDVPLPSFPALQNDIEVEVVVVGGGLTGITTAWLLREAGVRVALLERARLASADTGRTTAHLTYVTDNRLYKLARHFGNDAARAFWEAGIAGIDEIARIVMQNDIDCEFRWIPGYLHEILGKPDAQEHEHLERDLQLAREFEFDASRCDAVPYAHEYGICFRNQAKFHPRKYLAALAQKIPGSGSHIFENTALEEVQEQPLLVRANGRSIRCNYLVIATHNPLMGIKGLLGAALFQTKLALYTSYVIGARLPQDTLPEALFWDTDDPYHYLRIDAHDGYQYAICGGEDVKTGQEGDANKVFERLEQYLLKALPMAAIQHRWLGQVVETDDGLPFIGENASKEFIGTGFCGNGFTLGTLSAMMARDRYLQRRNPWFDLFRVDRRPFHGGIWRYVRENLDYPFYLLRDRMTPADAGTLEDLARTEGRVLQHEGRKVAAYRSAAGEVTLCSPVCTHMKCLVHWNAADKTWDCPCHGSRFHPGGEVLSGPAEEPLQVFSSATKS